MASSYYEVPQVLNSQPEFLPDVLRYTGFAMVLVAFLGFFAAKAESKLGMTTYCILSGILMANLAIFTLLVTFGTKVLQQNMSEKCYEVLPFFHRGYVRTFGCLTKYTMDSADIGGLTCTDKNQIAAVWEANVGEDYSTQTELFGCLNTKCCEPMISYIRSRFDFLSAFCIVAFFYLLVSIVSTRYMYKKTKKFRT